MAHAAAGQHELVGTVHHVARRPQTGHGFRLARVLRLRSGNRQTDLVRQGLGQNTIPQPVAADGMVFVMSGFRNPNLMAIRLGQEGDLTGTDAVVWQNQRGNSYTASPVLHDGKLYVLTDSGMLSCFDAKTGKPYYQQERLPKPYNFKASPVGANGKLYLSSENDDVIVVKMGEKFEVLATNTLDGQTFIASPAILGRRNLFTGAEHVVLCTVEPARPGWCAGMIIADLFPGIRAPCRRNLPRRSCCRRPCTAPPADRGRAAVSCPRGCW